MRKSYSRPKRTNKGSERSDVMHVSEGLATALQNPYTNSISPGSISNLRDVPSFVEFMGYFERDCKEFIRSCKQLDDFIAHFSKIGRELRSKDMLDGLLTRVNFHSTLTDYKVEPIEDYIKLLWQDYLRRNGEIYYRVQTELSRPISLPPSEEEFESLTSDEQRLVTQAYEELQINRIRFIAGVGGFITQIFFAVESTCKILCSLGCFPFSILYAQHEIISHGNVWRCLKRLGKIIQRNISCQICMVTSTCHFSINFEALANVYCYAIKFRMLSDYEDFFYNYEESWERIKVYFDKLKEVIRSQRKIEEKCLEAGIQQ